MQQASQEWCQNMVEFAKLTEWFNVGGSSPNDESVSEFKIPLLLLLEG